MPNNQVTSLHSPHVERVKALLGSRGKKVRQAEKLFVADGIQSVREALTAGTNSYEQAPELVNLYLTEKGAAKLATEIDSDLLKDAPIVNVSDAVMDAMAQTETPQGILALCKYTEMTLYKIAQRQARKIAYFWEIQDPGNSGTVIRTAEACGFDAVIVENIPFEELAKFAKEHQFKTIGLAGEATDSLLDLSESEKTILIFGNEARGLPAELTLDQRVRIPMKGASESLNVASAAAIAMFEVGIR